jgi:hypothetical protein
MDIVDNNGVSYTQSCVNFTSDGRPISVSIMTNVLYAGNLYFGLARSGGVATVVSTNIIAAPAPGAQSAAFF